MGDKAEHSKVTLCDGGGHLVPADGMQIPAALARWTVPFLGRLTLKFRARFEQHLGALGLRSKHFGVLLLLQDGPRSQVEIGRDLLVDRTTMVALIDDLVRAGYVERSPHPEDRRAYAVTLTAQGRDVLPEVTAMADATESECMAALSPDEKQQLRDFLARLL